MASKANTSQPKRLKVHRPVRLGACNLVYMGVLLGIIWAALVLEGNLLRRGVEASPMNSLNLLKLGRGATIRSLIMNRNSYDYPTLMSMGNKYRRFGNDDGSRWKVANKYALARLDAIEGNDMTDYFGGLTSGVLAKTQVPPSLLSFKQPGPASVSMSLDSEMRPEPVWFRDRELDAGPEGLKGPRFDGLRDRSSELNINNQNNNNDNDMDAQSPQQSLLPKQKKAYQPEETETSRVIADPPELNTNTNIINNNYNKPFKQRKSKEQEEREKRRVCNYDPNELNAKQSSYCDTDSFLNAFHYSGDDLWQKAGR